MQASFPYNHHQHLASEMAKSLRSKSKLRAKSVKRKGEFQAAVDDRQKRIVARCEADLKKQNEETEKKKDEDKDEDNVKDVMAVDETPKSDKPVSTSGWRKTRHTAYKQRNNTKSKKHMKFGKVNY
ncbi:hypothetical protein BABINDRAFT_14853 [Babjeviella inositovora NRRL Y-12698]|uniref:DUF2423 domain-containing protein n=1 Tax=Babjeviella inositovora NRRL Y-12698 TaxID=984486 RepID=A0A1E3QME3_9ASCO|nr:uncharacterized protein BABINDRAFT_14853 [Babjeviella inositovora NRRL Y-12698]ODQ78262.1 hypothetical protein BABINDRAFT_14853 [Babjeviella inositovora NRRL Y-12698]